MQIGLYWLVVKLYTIKHIRKIMNNIEIKNKYPHRRAEQNLAPLYIKREITLVSSSDVSLIGEVSKKLL